MPNLRHERVRELLRRAIGEAIRREFNVSAVGLITVNDIDVGGDLKSAVVFITILGNAGQQKHGLQVLEQNRFDLIFLDVEMPKPDGIEVCERLRKMPSNRTTPVVFVTSHADEETRAQHIDQITLFRRFAN